MSGLMDFGSARKDDWNTPAYIFEALGCRFDLDVAASKNGPRNVPCDRWIWENSLSVPWSGFIWMNPPFGNQSDKRRWLRKFFDHGNGIALIPDRTSAPWWQEAAPRSDAILFMSPKIKFELDDGNILGAPSNGTCLLASGDKAVAALSRARGLGVLMSVMRKS